MKKEHCKPNIDGLMAKFKKVGSKQLLKEMRKSNVEWLDFTFWTEEYMRKGCVINTAFESKASQDKRAAELAKANVQPEDEEGDYDMGLY